MRFLLPPSETKVAGGVGDFLDTDALSFEPLASARHEVIRALQKLCADQEKAASLLKLGVKNRAEILWNLELFASKTLPAIERYDGTLFDALKGIEPAVAGGAVNPLSELASSRLGGHVFVQSALFGLVSSTDSLPAYRLSASSVIPGLSLKRVWSEAHSRVWNLRAALGGGALDWSESLVVDLRSKSYAELAPLPTDGRFRSVWVEVVHEAPDGTRKPMNHFNKKAKGIFVRAALQAKTLPSSFADLVAVAREVDLEIELQTGDQTLVLITRERLVR